MRSVTFSSIIFSVIVIGVLGAQTKPTIKNVPVKPTSPVSGKEMFATYCAVCHGADAKGGGPAAAALKNRPTDLAQLSAINRGKYPELSVVSTLSGREVDAHGSQEMPIWGDLFRSLGSDMVHMRIGNLTAYIGSIQAK
jgi:mono/diheme cytochrome c family protein